MNGYGFWRWHFWLQENNELNNGYRLLLEKFMRWLAIQKKIKRVVLETNQLFGRVGQPLQLTTYLYDNAFKPVTNGNVQIEIDNGYKKIILDAFPADSSGTYSATFIPGKQGLHIFKAMGKIQQRFVGSDVLKMEVLPVEKEWLHNGVNKTYLEQIANDNHGLYVSAGEIDSLRSLFTGKEKIKKEILSVELWQKTVILVLILVLIGLEWIVRKRFGLV